MLNSSRPRFHSELLNNIHFSIQKEKDLKRRVDVQLLIPHAIEQVWQCLTTYNRLPDIISNLSRCRLLNQIGVHKQVEMVGYCRILNVGFSLRLVLEVIESAPYRIETQLVQGDLRSYWGLWCLTEQGEHSMLLSYSAEFIPKLGMPLRLIEKQVQTLLPLNFLAIRLNLDQTNPDLGTLD
ncbi:MAG: SRPBCC family protein [Leptolyngbyaceae cyanobacterium bins.59]|nr:SRPBCC family protein [Leptolyngbyaceae cyanobacterium bins.59]